MGLEQGESMISPCLKLTLGFAKGEQINELRPE